MSSCYCLPTYNSKNNCQVEFLMSIFYAGSAENKALSHNNNIKSNEKNCHLNIFSTPFSGWLFITNLTFKTEFVKINYLFPTIKLRTAC